MGRAADRPCGARGRPRISVLLPTKNAGPLFRRVLDTILAQQGAGIVEVVIVDSGSTDGTLDLAAAYPVRVYRLPSAAFGHGRVRNHLARLARGDILVFLSSDAIPAHDRWLAALVAPLHEARVAATFGRQVPRPGAHPTQVYALHHWYPARPRRMTGVRADDFRAMSVFYSHVNAACKKSVWERFPFDERLIMSEDQRWVRQVLPAGYEIEYVPEAAVIHSHDYTLAGAFRRNFDSGVALRAIADETIAQWGALGLRYLGAELRFLARAGHAAAIPYACVHEAIRFAGFVAGFHHGHLPRALKARVGQHGAHWQAPGAGEDRAPWGPVAPSAGGPR